MGTMPRTSQGEREGREVVGAYINFIISFGHQPYRCSVLFIHSGFMEQNLFF